MTSDRRFFSGDSLAQALNQAAQHFQVAPSELNYKQVEKRHGFLKVRRKVVIEIDGNNPVLKDPAPAATEAPAATKAPVVTKASEEPEAPAAQEAPATPRASEAAAKARPAGGASEGPGHDGTDEDTMAWPEPEPRMPPREPATASETETEATTDMATTPPTAETTSTSSPIETARADRAVAADHRSRRPRASRAEGPGIVLPEAPLPARTKFPVAAGEEADAAAQALGKVLALAGLDLESEILEAEEGLLIELWGEDQDILLRDRGRLLLAIQHLLPRVIRGLIGRSVVCKVDSDDFHMIREERLRDLAQRAADEVRHRGRPKTLEPMSPDERRIVHLTLADYPGIETESHGSGLFKRVMVRSSRG